jgi:hypothetical protein
MVVGWFMHWLVTMEVRGSIASCDNLFMLKAYMLRGGRPMYMPMGLTSLSLPLTSLGIVNNKYFIYFNL